MPKKKLRDPTDPEPKRHRYIHPGESTKVFGEEAGKKHKEYVKEYNRRIQELKEIAREDDDQGD